MIERSIYLIQRGYEALPYPGNYSGLPYVVSGSVIGSIAWNAMVDAINQTQQAIGTNPARAVAGGRLTLATGTPVPTSDTTGATTVYYTSFVSNEISLYDGVSNWFPYTFTSDLSLALGTLSGNTNYDIFCYAATGGIPTLELGPAWTNDTTRATGLVLQDGVWVKSGDSTRRYLGTVRSNSGTGSTVTDALWARNVYNASNRVARPVQVTDAAASWTYTTASWRQANANTANQIGVLVGLPGTVLHLQVDAVRSNTSSALGASGIGVASTTALGSGVIAVGNANIAGSAATSSARYDGYPGLGYTWYAWLESGSGTGTDTWTGTSGNVVSGMSGFVVV